MYRIAARAALCEALATMRLSHSVCWRELPISPEPRAHGPSAAECTRNCTHWRSPHHQNWPSAVPGATSCSSLWARQKPVSEVSRPVTRREFVCKRAHIAVPAAFAVRYGQAAMACTLGRRSVVVSATEMQLVFGVTSQLAMGRVE